MNCRTLVEAALLAAWCSLIVQAVPAQGQSIVVEPDHYAGGTALNQISPFVSLITAANNNLPHPPVPFDVRATTSVFPFLPSTGTNVFAHALGIPFWYTDRRLRMDFAGLVSTLSIDFQGGTANVQERGTLEVYSSQNVLLGAYVTAPLFGGQIETMNIGHASADIAYAIAYTLPGQTSFGRLDHLVFSAPVSVPEPTCLGLMTFGAMGFMGWRHCLARQRRRHAGMAACRGQGRKPDLSRATERNFSRR